LRVKRKLLLADHAFVADRDGARLADLLNALCLGKPAGKRRSTRG
jgi:hypothetical protein